MFNNNHEDQENTQKTSIKGRIIRVFTFHKLPEVALYQALELAIICGILFLVGLTFAVLRRNFNFFVFGTAISVLALLYFLVVKILPFMVGETMHIDGVVVPLNKSDNRSMLRRTYIRIETDGLFYTIPVSEQQADLPQGSMIRVYLREGDIDQTSENSYRTREPLIIQMLAEHDGSTGENTDEQ